MGQKHVFESRVYLPFRLAHRRCGRFPSWLRGAVPERHTEGPGDEASCADEEFYKALDEKEREEVNQIVENHQLTKAQFKEKIQQWVDQLPADKKEKANNLDEQNMQIIDQMMKEVQSKNLSAEANKIFEEIQKITENEGITRREECEQITGKLNALPQADRGQLSIPSNFELDCNKVTQIPFEQKENA